MKCPKCGYDNKDGADHCDLCKEILGETPVSSRPGPGSYQSKPAMSAPPRPSRPIISDSGGEKIDHKKEKNYLKRPHLLIITLVIIASVIYFYKNSIKGIISNEDFILQYKNNSLPGDYLTIKTPNFVIYHHNQKIADFLKKRIEKWYQQIKNELGANDNYTVISINIYRNANELGAVLGNTHKQTWVPAGTASIINRTISIHQQVNISNTLIHEIGHITFQDCISLTIPADLRWIDEGVASYLEEKVTNKDKDLQYEQLFKRGKYIPFAELLESKSFSYIDAAKSKLLYAQSKSIVKFLISNYGIIRFKEFCKIAYKKGYARNALLTVYKDEFSSILDLERKWRESI